MSHPTLPVGERVRFHRTRRGRTQAVVAGLCGITEDYLSQIERGLKNPSHAVLVELANQLQVPVAALLGDTEAARPDTPATAGTDVVRALLGQGSGTPGQPLASSCLRDRVEALWRI
ncbi:helix-turn-helix domain-containing protein [Streptomyces sp. NPDC057966]